MVDFTYVPTRSGFCCTAFVTGPVLPPHRRLGHQQPHGAPTTRPAPPGRRSGGASTATAATSRARHHHSDHGSQYLSIACTGRLVDEGIEASAGAVGSSYDNAAAEALGKSYKRELVWRDGPWKDRDDLETATAQWVNRCQPHPTPPRQPRRPLTRRRRTPLPSQPHHHHRRPARHGTTTPTKPRTIQTPWEFATTLEDTTPGRRGVSL